LSSDSQSSANAEAVPDSHRCLMFAHRVEVGGLAERLGQAAQLGAGLLLESPEAVGEVEEFEARSLLAARASELGLPLTSSSCPAFAASGSQEPRR